MNILIKRAASLYLVVLIFGMQNIGASQQSITFDMLFPQTSYQKALDIGMQVWGDLEMFTEKANNMTSEKQNIFFDLIAGRLVYMHICLEEMMESQPIIMRDDLSYVFDVVKEIKLLTNLQNKKYDHIKSIHRVVDQISGYLENKLQ